MSNGRKVIVELTQAEAQAAWLLLSGRDHDEQAAERARLKIERQLNAVRGKTR